jgi:hypothetical protein
MSTRSSCWLKRSDAYIFHTTDCSLLRNHWSHFMFTEWNKKKWNMSIRSNVLNQLKTILLFLFIISLSRAWILLNNYISLLLFNLRKIENQHWWRVLSMFHENSIDLSSINGPCSDIWSIFHTFEVLMILSYRNILKVDDVEDVC